MTWLITAFEPFGGTETNASLLLIDRLKEMDWQGQVSFFSPVPVTFSDAWPAVLQEIERSPDITGVLALGQAEGRSKISLERVALNWIDANIPDNNGQQPINCKIEDGAPELLWSNIPWDQLERSPHWDRSYSAGTYLCNALMYRLLRWCNDNGKKGGFVHVPLLASQQDFPAHTPRMADDVAAESLAQIIRFMITA